MNASVDVVAEISAKRFARRLDTLENKVDINPGSASLSASYLPSLRSADAAIMHIQRNCVFIDIDTKDKLLRKRKKVVNLAKSEELKISQRQSTAFRTFAQPSDPSFEKDHSEKMGKNSLRSQADSVFISINSNSVERRPSVALRARQNPDGMQSGGFIDTSSAEKIQLLLQKQKDLSAQELDREQNTQAELLRDLSELTGLLKNTSVGINQSVRQQNIQLDSIQHHASENRDELDSQKKRMKESTETMQSSIWTSMWLMLTILLVFALTYGIIRVLPVPTSRTCPSGLPVV